MTPDQLAEYTAKTRELLKDASYKRVGTGGVDPYSPVKVEGTPAGKPWTFVWLFSWTPEAEKQRSAWEALIQGFHLAIKSVYPDIPIVNVPFTVASSRAISVGFAQMYAKVRRSIPGNLIFIEPDVVCNKRCDPFEADFDVGLPDCKDQWPMMPFNPGVMFVKDTPGAQRFLDTAMEYCCYFPQNADPWYLYQLALSHAYLALKDEVKITVFPHELYNYAPAVVAPTDAYFVHLKGHRKSMQKDFVLPVVDGRQGHLIVPQMAHGRG